MLKSRYNRLLTILFTDWLRDYDLKISVFFKKLKLPHFTLSGLFFIVPLFAEPVSETIPAINIPKARSVYDLSQDYHQTLLLMALKKAAHGRAIPEINSTVQMSQGRAKAELVKGKLINLYWFGTSIEMEEELRAIPIPTTKGLIGYRKFIIRKDTLTTFNSIKNLDDLRTLTACQGQHWPDTQILQAANLKVITTPTYENIFRMLNAKRCDYFPRGYHDTDNDLFLRKALFSELMPYHEIILHYPFAVYFFTNKKDESLAQWIEEGLRLLAVNNEIDQLMQSHPLTAHIYPLKDEQNTLYLPIANQLLNNNADPNDQLLWFTPKDFNIRYQPQIN